MRWLQLVRTVRVTEEGTLSDDPDAIRDGLRGASDGLLVAIHQVEARERLKRAVAPHDPRFASLARDVRVAAEVVLTLARDEEREAEQATAAAAGASLPTIDASKPPPDLATILAEWRQVERDLEAADPASTAGQELMLEFDRLRAQYAEVLKRYR